jgi:hypothetical protein
MATKTLAALAAVSLLVTACVSPYEESIKSDLAACQAGNKDACFEAHALTDADRAWHAQKNAEAGNVLLGVLAIGLAGASIAAAAHAPPPPPVFIPPPPIFVPRW